MTAHLHLHPKLLQNLLKFLSLNPAGIQYITNPSHTMLVTVLSKDPEIVQYISDQDLTDEMVDYVISRTDVHYVGPECIVEYHPQRFLQKHLDITDCYQFLASCEHLRTRANFINGVQCGLKSRSDYILNEILPLFENMPTQLQIKVAERSANLFMRIPNPCAEAKKLSDLIHM